MNRCHAFFFRLDDSIVGQSPSVPELADWTVTNLLGSYLAA